MFFIIIIIFFFLELGVRMGWFEIRTCLLG